MPEAVTRAMPPLTLRFTRLSPTHHRMELLRAGGEREAADLETKSFLLHDFLHFAVETEAKLAGSFFGKLAAGYSYGDLTAKGKTLTGELLTTERIVGALTGVIRGDVGVREFQDGLANLFGALGEPVPPYASDAFVAAVAARYRALVGEWKATAFGAAMELKFQV